MKTLYVIATLLAFEFAFASTGIPQWEVATMNCEANLNQNVSIVKAKFKDAKVGLYLKIATTDSDPFYQQFTSMTNLNDHYVIYESKNYVFTWASFSTGQSSKVVHKSNSRKAIKCTSVGE